MKDVTLNPSPNRILTVVRQHGEEAAALRNSRSALTTASYAKLHHLRSLDDRLAAHLDGLAIAGDHGWRFCEAALEDPGVGQVFTASVRAIEDKSTERLDRLFAIVEALPMSRAGLISACGWVSPQHLQGITSTQLSSVNPSYRAVGLATCAMHRVDPGVALDSSIDDTEPQLRARGLRTAGQLGRRDLLVACVRRFTDEDEACRFWAAHSAVLLGNRDAAVGKLEDIAMQDGPYRSLALKSLLRVVQVAQADSVLRRFSKGGANERLLIQGAGVAGDPRYVPWLVRQMADLKLTRLAGESFSFITGVDLAHLNLDRERPEDFESGPNDNPDDADVSTDPDDDLPWPDPPKIQAWWDVNSSRFTEGVRYFVGAPVTPEHCVHVLKEGYQRQRIAAAQHLCLLRPGMQLFPTSAPARRQRRWLAQMG
jgi:uncharacterized protein (TIGR02270 family)